MSRINILFHSKKDFSNFHEVVEKIKSDEYLEQLTERAYQDIILSRAYTYERFIEGFEHDLNKLNMRKKTHRTLYSQLISFDKNGMPQEIMPMLPHHLSEFKLPVMSPFSLSNYVADKSDEFNRPLMTHMQQQITDFEQQVGELQQQIEKRESQLLAQNLQVKKLVEQLQTLSHNADQVQRAQSMLEDEKQLEKTIEIVTPPNKLKLFIRSLGVNFYGMKMWFLDF